MWRDYSKLGPLYQLCNPSEEIKKQQVRQYAVGEVDPNVLI